jgi:hypothetical protein
MRNLTQRSWIVSFSSPGVPETTPAYSWFKIAGFALNRSPKFPSRFDENPLLVGNSARLLRQGSPYSFTGQFHDGPLSAHHPMCTVSDNRFGVGTVVEQPHSGEQFDNIFDSLFLISFGKKPLTKSPRRTWSSIKEVQCGFTTRIDIIRMVKLDGFS